MPGSPYHQLTRCTRGCFVTSPGLAGAPLHTRSPSRSSRSGRHRFERLCSRALAENVISEAKAAELLGKSVRDLHQWMEQPPQD